MQLDLALAAELASERRAAAAGKARPGPSDSALRRTENRLRGLEARYRGALSRAVAAKAAYLALRDDRAATPEAIRRAYRRWQLLQLRRKAYAARMALIERRELQEADTSG